MSGVDVLAVWGRAIEMVEGFDDADAADDGDDPIVAPLIHDMRSARAAVAELIEKSTTALHYMRLHAYADQAWADDLEASLARCRGGAV